MPETLRDYFGNTVKPTVDEYLSGNGRFNIRRARLAAIVVEHVIDYYLWLTKKTGPKYVKILQTYRLCIPL